MDPANIVVLIGRALIALGNFLVAGASPADVLRLVARIENESRKVSADVDGIANGG